MLKWRNFFSRDSRLCCLFNASEKLTAAVTWRELGSIFVSIDSDLDTFRCPLLLRLLLLLVVVAVVVMMVVLLLLRRSWSLL